MARIKSLEELIKVREEALEKRKVKAASGEIQVIVGMGTCGIAAGARETMKTILEDIIGGLYIAKQLPAFISAY